MGEAISYIVNPRSRKMESAKAPTDMFSPEKARAVREFHRRLPFYEPTPLVQLAQRADELGVSKVCVKDESHRFGLNAFKVLGATFGVAHALAKRLELVETEISFDTLRSSEIRSELSTLTLVTATDGNHGRAVAWVAQKLGCRSVVYLPEGTARARYESIRAHGADAFLISGNYDKAVRIAADQAERNGWLLIQDSAWEGYEEVPSKIMQGYLTILDEALEQLGSELPTHILVQCGVGSLAASLQAFLVEKYGLERPQFIVVEPKGAACFFESVTAGDDEPRTIEGELNTIMAGLACGTPSTLAWNILRDYADAFVECSDQVTIEGMRALGNPLEGDKGVISGESGAVTMGLCKFVLKEPGCREARRDLKLDADSKILLISTEGDTDPDRYAEILRGGP
ncbi:MAG: diaminopropionate ammonia-lyase [Candidatus Glassbacteria bacterium]